MYVEPRYDALHLESEVRSYSRKFPDVFEQANGSLVRAASGREYVDFFAGAGSLNYGHSNPAIIEPVIRFLSSGGLVNALDMLTPTRAAFLAKLDDYVLGRRGDYVVQFCGPTGTNAVEAALRLARKVTDRWGIVAFAGGYHGNTLGSLQVTSNRFFRKLPDGGRSVRFLSYTREAVREESDRLHDDYSGIEPPAAYLIETTQAEGGVNVGSPALLQAVSQLAREVGALVIVDDIQVGCHRVGPFLSFAECKVWPDIVLLSKSLSGFGTPFSVLLIKREFDQWAPGEHSGTFRGNQLGMVGAVAAMEFAERVGLPAQVAAKGRHIEKVLVRLAEAAPCDVAVRGTGMIWGLDFSGSGDDELAARIQAECFTRGLILETCGRRSQVLKILPPLTIPTQVLRDGMDALRLAVEAAAAKVRT